MTMQWKHHATSDGTMHYDNPDREMDRYDRAGPTHQTLSIRLLRGSGYSRLATVLETLNPNRSGCVMVGLLGFQRRAHLLTTLHACRLAREALPSPFSYGDLTLEQQAQHIIDHGGWRDVEAVSPDWRASFDRAVGTYRLLWPSTTSTRRNAIRQSQASGCTADGILERAVGTEAWSPQPDATLRVHGIDVR